MGTSTDDRQRREQAREQLIMAYRGLARNIARKYRDRDEGIPFEDLEQVAYLGLIKAIDRFEPERGFEFSTFATPTITGELRRYFRDKGFGMTAGSSPRRSGTGKQSKPE